MCVYLCPTSTTSIIWCHSLWAWQTSYSSSVVCAAIWWQDWSLNRHGILNYDRLLMDSVLLERFSIVWWPLVRIFMRPYARTLFSFWWFTPIGIFKSFESIGELLHLARFVLLRSYEFTLEPLRSKNWTQALHLIWRLCLFVMIDAKQLLFWTLLCLFLFQYLFYLCLWQLLQRIDNRMEISCRWQNASFLHILFQIVQSLLLELAETQNVFHIVMIQLSE